MGIARVTSKGQITIPAEIRTSLNIRAGDSLLFEKKNEDRVRVQVIRRRSLTELGGALASDRNYPGKTEIRESVAMDRAQQILDSEEES